MERVQYTIQQKNAISNLQSADNLQGRTATQQKLKGPSEHIIEPTRYDLEMQMVHELKVVLYIHCRISVLQQLKSQFQYYSKFQAQILDNV